MAGKMEAKIDVCDVFSNLFFECVLGSHFCCFLEAPNLKNHALASTGARFSQNRRFRKILKKKLDFGFIFGGQNVEKSRNNGVEKRVCFEYLILCVFLRIFAISARFWEAPGAPKIAKNRKQTLSGRVRSAFGIRVRFLQRCWSDFGRFWMDSGSFLSGF